MRSIMRGATFADFSFAPAYWASVPALGHQYPHYNCLCTMDSLLPALKPIAARMLHIYPIWLQAVFWTHFTCILFSGKNTSIFTYSKALRSVCGDPACSCCGSSSEGSLGGQAADTLANRGGAVHDERRRKVRVQLLPKVPHLQLPGAHQRSGRSVRLLLFGFFVIQQESGLMS